VEATEAFTEDACYVPLFGHLLLLYRSDIFFVLLLLSYYCIVLLGAQSVPLRFCRGEEVRMYLGGTLRHVLAFKVPPAGRHVMCSFLKNDKWESSMTSSISSVIPINFNVVEIESSSFCNIVGTDSGKKIYVLE